MTKARTATALAAALTALAAPAAAQGAYAPALDMKLTPAAPDSPAAITSTVTQTSGETASKTVRVSFPPAFGANSAGTVVPCTPAQEGTATDHTDCPEASRIGTASATASVLGVPLQLTGNVYQSVTPGLRILVYLRDSPLGLQPQKIVGTIQQTPAGFDFVFDNLPNVLTTSFQLKLEGGPKALLTTPKACEPLTFKGDFTSQNGEKASSSSTVQVTDCPTAPVISGVKVKPKKFKTVRRSSDRARSGYGTTLTWSLSQVTPGTNITVERSVKAKKKGRKPKWKRVGKITGPSAAGANSLKFDGRLKDKRLKAGKYRFGLTTTNAKGLDSTLRRVKFEIKK
jgi:hypothetical protein